MSDGERSSPVPRGLSLEQAQIVGIQRRQDEQDEKIERVTQALEQLLAQLRQPHLAATDPGLDEEDAEGIRVDEYKIERDAPPPQQLQRNLGSNIKMKIPTFKGTSDPEEYLEWVQRVEKIFECQDYSELKKCKLAALEFTSYANLWWENITAQRRRDGEGEVRSWRLMKQLMRKRFVAEYYKQELYIRLQTLGQGALSVED